MELKEPTGHTSGLGSNGPQSVGANRVEDGRRVKCVDVGRRPAWRGVNVSASGTVS